jgi:carbamoyl-phosphate synthase small subunit
MGPVRPIREEQPNEPTACTCANLYDHADAAVRSVTVVEAALVLADGSVFEGELLGAEPAGGVASGEVVFNTVLSGYQEVITDPSYAGQIITFTNPHIGNHGVNRKDFESVRPFCRGVVVRQLARRHSNQRAQGGLDEMLRRYGISGIGGIDTRRLTRVLRDTGAMPGAFGTAPVADLHAAAAVEPGTDGLDLVAEVTTAEAYTVASAQPRTIVAYDFGIKHTIVRQLTRLGTVHVVPASTPAADVLALAPDGVFLSNGPGDPCEVPDAVEAIRGLLGNVPVFGICLGHQLLGRALGGETFKLPFGHHGGNHPVRNESTGHVEITSQNHNFAVAADSLAGLVDVTHVNLNDGTNEGMRVRDVRAFSVQYHPEAGPGPHDSRYLFADFAALMDGHPVDKLPPPPAHLHGLPEPLHGVA